MEFDKIFNSEDVKDYNLFIEKLRQLKEKGCSTKDILYLIYQYYKKYVTYNYDQLQLVKLNRYEKDEPGSICEEAFEEIQKRIDMINEISRMTQKSPKEIVNSNEVDKPYSKEEAIELLDEAFLKVEGRKLTERNKERIFENYGKIIHIPYKPAGTRILKTHEVLEHDEIRRLTRCPYYEPVYSNGMLIDGVCAEYKKFEKKICKDLGIKHLEVSGIGTTGHGWSLIYLPEEQKWVHFDMTMVKFYQDGWIKNHEPYTMEDWIAASTSDIFKMQTTRKITEINGVKCYFDKDNYAELDISKFDKEAEREQN